MAGFVTYFDPEPQPAELPARLPSPFAPGPPHPLARRAAERLRAQLEAGEPWPVEQFEGSYRGKMFAVLVVADAGGRIGYLRALLGDDRRALGRSRASWARCSTLAARDRFWPSGEAELDAFDRQLAAAGRRARRRSPSASGR